MAYSVAIVVDRDFGARLRPLAQRMHVWVCATPENRGVAEAYWRAVPIVSIEQGITTFNVAESASPEEMLIGILAAVDLHHGEYSHDPPWDTLEVYGTTATPAIREALETFGVERIVPTEDGFHCFRTIEDYDQNESGST